MIPLAFSGTKIRTKYAYCSTGEAELTHYYLLEAIVGG